MRIYLAISVLLFSLNVCAAQKPKNREPTPIEIVIGRNSFIDVGPPFNYYDLTFLRSDGENTDVERISLTPPADSCYPHAEIWVAHLSLDEPLSHVLQGMNPCTIPEGKLRAELQRRSKGPVFSGMNVSIQVACAGGTRIIRAEILDRDIFDEHPNTPQYTAWSRALFEKLDQATGDHPWDKPLFPVSGTSPAVIPDTQSQAMQAIADGKFDAIFGDVTDRLSELYQSAQTPLRHPFIELTSSEPVRPKVYVEPVYPPIARAARVNGVIEFHMTVSADGSATEAGIDSGPMMLRRAVIEAIAKWKFSPDDSGKVINSSIRFGLNCAGESK